MSGMYGNELCVLDVLALEYGGENCKRFELARVVKYH